MIYDKLKATGRLTYAVYDSSGALKLQGASPNQVKVQAANQYRSLQVGLPYTDSSISTIWYMGLIRGDNYTTTSIYDRYDTNVSTHPGWSEVSSNTLISTLRPQWYRAPASNATIAGSTVSWTSVATNVNFSVAGILVMTENTVNKTIHQLVTFPGFLYATGIFTAIVTLTPGDTLEVDYEAYLGSA